MPKLIFAIELWKEHIDTTHLWCWFLDHGKLARGAPSNWLTGQSGAYRFDTGGTYEVEEEDISSWLDAKASLSCGKVWFLHLWYVDAIKPIDLFMIFFRRHTPKQWANNHLTHEHPVALHKRRAQNNTVR